jgi:hypothetical protein
MENNINIDQLIDQYVSGNMTDAEKINFEQLSASDPNVAQELGLQKDIVIAIKTQRKTMLKTRLNNIDVSGLTTTTGTSIGWKIAAGILLVSGATIGTLLYINSNEAKINDTTVNKNSVEVIAKPVEEEVENIIVEQKSTVAKENVVVLKDAKEDAKVEPSKVINQKPSTKKTTISIKSNDTPRDMALEQDILTDGNTKVPTGGVATYANKNISTTDVAVTIDKDYKFHYKYAANQLYLYCDFQAKPYEIIELNAKKNKTLYLYFNSKYYELKSNTAQISPLKAFKNTAVIKQLEEIRLYK